MASKECKERFIEEVAAAGINFSDLAQEFFDELQSGAAAASPITEKGLNVLKFMVANRDRYNNIFKSQSIAADLGISSRTVSGTMRKLVADGFVHKEGQNPVCYSLTEQGAQMVDFV